MVRLLSITVQQNINGIKIEIIKRNTKEKTMKTFGIISAMTVEIEQIYRSMNIEKELNICGFPFYIGSIYKVKVVLTTCSVGKVNAACCTQLMISNFDVDYIINTGIAGALYSELKLKDIVISSDVTYYDVRKIQMKTCYPCQESFKSSDELVELAQKACHSILGNEASYYKGRIATGDNFISTSEEKESIYNEFAPYCVEMEGGAIGHVAYLNHTPFVIIRCISDLADDEAAVTYEEFETIAAIRSAKITLKILELYHDKD